jgi:glycine cleavage system H protein
MLIRGLEFPELLDYLVEHQVWARDEGDGTATVGITSLGIRLGGEIYMCRPKATGATVEQGHSVAVVELAKSIVSVKSPVTGVIVDVNAALGAHPELVHRDPYAEGWIARVHVADFARDRERLVHGASAVPALEEYAWLNQVQ